MTQTHNWASEIFEGFPQSYPQGRPFGVVLDDLLFATFLSPATEAAGLLVLLWGSPGNDGERPVLAKPNMGRPWGLHTLTISDPSLFLDDDLETGVFLGAENNDPIAGVIALVANVAASLNIPEERIVVMGLSSGGFASVMTACRGGWKAIAVNPQLDLPTIRKAPSAPILLRRFRPGITPDQLGEEFPLRCLASAAFLDALAAGRRPKLAIFQNQLDDHHYRKHFRPFCSAISMTEAGGVSADGLVRTEILDYPEGHSSPEEVRTIALAEGLAFVMPREGKPLSKITASLKAARSRIASHGKA